MSFEELVFCLALGPDTDTHHSLWSEDWNVVMFLCQTQTVGCGAYMTRMRHPTKHEPAYYHVYTSCSCLCPGSCLHFTKSAWNPFKLRAQNAVIWKYDLVFTEMNASRYLLISISHDSKNEKYPRISNFWCWQVTCHQSESVKYYTSPESSDICSLQQPSQSSVSWSRNIRQLFGRKYLTILIAYLALLTVWRSARERRGIIFAKMMSDPGSEARVKHTNIYCYRLLSLYTGDETATSFFKTFPSMLTCSNIQHFVWTLVPSFHDFNEWPFRRCCHQCCWLLLLGHLQVSQDVISDLW